MGRIYTEVSVDIDDILDEIDTDDLVDELKRRRIDYNTEDVEGDAMREVHEVLEKIWLKRREGKDYQRELDRLIYDVLGKIV
jgi:hypothetical protein